MTSITDLHRRAFVCATPYQIYNVLAIILSDVVEGNVPPDIFIIGGFANAEQTANRLHDTHMFCSVVFVPSELDAYGLGEKKLGKDGETRSLEAVDRYLSSLPGTVYMPPADGYDELLFSLPTLTAAYLVASSPNAQLSLFDDGYGSYYGDILGASGWNRRTPDELRVWFPEMCNTDIACLVLPMPNVESIAGLKNRLSATVNAVFGYAPLHVGKHKGDDHAKLVYMSQPMGEGKLTQDAAKIVRKMLGVGTDLGMPVVAKPHPREAADDVISGDGTIMDERGLSLEVLCVNEEINDDTLLMGMFSTSQYLPAMMFDVYPKLLFLYRIMLSDIDEIRKIDALVDEISLTYGGLAGDRICVADTVEEAINFLISCQKAKRS